MGGPGLPLRRGGQGGRERCRRRGSPYPSEPTPLGARGRRPGAVGLEGVPRGVGLGGGLLGKAKAHDLLHQAGIIHTVLVLDIGNGFFIELDGAVVVRNSCVWRRYCVCFNGFFVLTAPAAKRGRFGRLGNCNGRGFIGACKHGRRKPTRYKDNSYPTGFVVSTHWLPHKNYLP